jgi:hypothetical protein
VTSLPSFPMTRQLKNGVTLSIHDQSRRLASDRWLAILRCEAALPVQEEFWQGVGPLETEMIASIRQKTGPTLCHVAEQKRHFVDEADLPEVIAELLERIESTMAPYFAGPTFPEKLFARHVALCRDMLLAEGQKRSLAMADKEDDDPVDFSHCFKD